MDNDEKHRFRKVRNKNNHSKGSMFMKAKKIPEFKSAEEEQEFWDQHSALEFLEDGQVVEIDASKAREKRDKRSTQQISLRISHHILERTKRRAKTLGVPYQTLIQLWLAERLEEEEAFLSSLTNLSTKRGTQSSPRRKAVGE